MRAFPGVYEAKTVGFSGGVLNVLIPQVFGTEAVPVAGVSGPVPADGTRGFVAFISGQIEYPVWLSGGGEAVDHPTDADPAPLTFPTGGELIELLGGSEYLSTLLCPPTAAPAPPPLVISGGGSAGWGMLVDGGSANSTYVLSLDGGGTSDPNEFGGVYPLDGGSSS